MRRLLLPAAALGLCACAGAPPAPPAVPPGATFVVSVSEAVASPEQDVPTRLKVYKDGQLAGETASGPASQPRQWGAVLAPANYLFRFERWVQLSSAPSEGITFAPAAQQPRERFIRVAPGERTDVTLKFLDGGLTHDYQISRAPLPVTVPAKR